MFYSVNHVGQPYLVKVRIIASNSSGPSLLRISFDSETTSLTSLLSLPRERVASQIIVMLMNFGCTLLYHTMLTSLLDSGLEICSLFMGSTCWWCTRIWLDLKTLMIWLDLPPIRLLGHSLQEFPMCQRYANWKLEQKVIGTMPWYHFSLYPSRLDPGYTDAPASIGSQDQQDIHSMYKLRLGL
jgi:hypothetical protein